MRTSPQLQRATKMEGGQTRAIVDRRGSIWIRSKVLELLSAEHESNAGLIAAVDNPLGQQVDDPGLPLRVEHIPEVTELGQRGGDVFGIDGRWQA